MIRSDETPAEPFVAWAQQREAARLGMWLFLASEAMMFGSLIMVAWFFRLRHPDGVAEAVAGLHHLLAAGNTVLLLTSSLLMTLAASEPRRVRQYLLGAAVLGAMFLGCKGVEYGLEIQAGVLPGFADHAPWQAPSAQLFINLYFIATALHGVHVLVAVGLALWLSRALKHQRLAPHQAATRLEMISLYWHLVDGIWILLFPTLYLVGR